MWGIFSVTSAAAALSSLLLLDTPVATSNWESELYWEWKLLNHLRMKEILTSHSLEFYVLAFIVYPLLLDTTITWIQQSSWDWAQFIISQPPQHIGFREEKIYFQFLVKPDLQILVWGDQVCQFWFLMKTDLLIWVWGDQVCQFWFLVKSADYRLEGFQDEQ